MTKAPYIVYTPDKDFVLEKDDISGGGGSIPIASADTLGGVKVGNGLSITEEGVLSASGSSGGSGVFIINATYDESASGYVLDKTIEEIEAASDNGLFCIISGEMSTFVSVVDTPIGALISFDQKVYIDDATNIIRNEIYSINNETEVVSVTTSSYTLTPVE